MLSMLTLNLANLASIFLCANLLGKSTLEKAGLALLGLCWVANNILLIRAAKSDPGIVPRQSFSGQTHL